MLHEKEFVKAFVTPLRQSRYLSLLESSRGRLKMVRSLDHFDDMDMRYAKVIPTDQQSISGIERLLKQKGSPTLCHVISLNSSIDNQEISLSKALEEVVGQGMGTVISCIPGRLAYFEGEEPCERYILERPA